MVVTLLCRILQQLTQSYGQNSALNSKTIYFSRHFPVIPRKSEQNWTLWSKIIVYGYKTCRNVLLSFSQPNCWVHLPILASQNDTMAKKALSERVKRQKQSHLKEEKLQKAIDVYREEQKLEPSQRKGARKIAKDFGVENRWQTIIYRYKGGRSTREVHEEQQKLTPAEEVVLVDFVKQSAECGFPPALKNI